MATYNCRIRLADAETLADTFEVSQDDGMATTVILCFSGGYSLKQTGRLWLQDD